MQIVKLTKDKYQLWNEFCLGSNDAWFWHTADWQEYILSYISESRPEKQNLSFLVCKKDRPVAVVPLIWEVSVQAGKKIREFAFDGWVVPAPALANDLAGEKKEEVQDLIFREIDRLAKEHKIVRAKFGLKPLAAIFLNKKNIFNYLMKFGYLDISLNTQIIDLSRSEAQLWAELRRNHRRNIIKGQDFKIVVYTAKNITKKIFQAYKDMHRKAAGRQTRPDKTFELMYKWLKRDLAFLAVVEFENKQVGFEYYSVYKNNVYGFSAANDPDYGHLPIRHFLEWQAILWMKKQGLTFYEIGLQQYGNLLYDLPSEKQLNISHFKKGFGGLVVLLLMGEKYYDKKFFLEVYSERIRKFAESLGKN